MDPKQPKQLIARRFLEALAQHKERTHRTWAEIARATGIPESTMRYWYAADNPIPSAKLIARVVRVLKLDAGRIYGRRPLQLKQYCVQDWPQYEPLIRAYAKRFRAEDYEGADRVLGLIMEHLFYYFRGLGLPVRAIMYGSGQVLEHRIYVDMGYFTPHAHNYVIRFYGNAGVPWLSAERIPDEIDTHGPRSVRVEETEARFLGPFSASAIKWATERFVNEYEACQKYLMQLQEGQKMFEQQMTDTPVEI